MRHIQLYIICLTTLWFMGCASSKLENKEEPTDQKFTFKTKLIETNFGMNSDDLANTGKVLYQVIAECEESNCVPEEAKLSFNRPSGSNKLYLSNRNLTLNMGEDTYKWQEHEWSNIYNSPPVVGVIKTVTLKWDALVKLAESKEVTGNLAGQNFEWMYKNRAPIREIVSKTGPTTQKN